VRRRGFWGKLAAVAIAPLGKEIVDSSDPRAAINF
jgi:uncharacterized membrane protein YccF (DUF307 family)